MVHSFYTLLHCVTNSFLIKKLSKVLFIWECYLLCHYCFLLMFSKIVIYTTANNITVQQSTIRNTNCIILRYIKYFLKHFSSTKSTREITFYPIRFSLAPQNILLIYDDIPLLTNETWVSIRWKNNLHCFVQCGIVWYCLTSEYT